jgi:hypothetical protein
MLDHRELIKGGIIMFELGDNHEDNFFKKSVPQIPLEDFIKLLIRKNKNNRDLRLNVNNHFFELNDFVTNPVIEGGTAVFKEKKLITIKNRQPKSNIFYTINGMEPNEKSILYNAPFEIDSTVNIKAIAIDRGNKKSAVVEAHYFKNSKNWKVTLSTPFLSQYTAGGGEGLVDGIRGGINWRTGNWQGYQTENMNAVVDLNEIKKIHSVTIGFLQDVRSWIVMPKKVCVMVSVDGKKYEQVYSGENFLNIEDASTEIKNVNATFESRSVRYIKVIAEQYGALPSWHPGAGGDSIIFTDEIDVQ